MPSSNKSFPIASFMNLFKEIKYDESQEANYSFDIWDSFLISPHMKDNLSYFVTHIISSGDTWSSMAINYYDDARLWWVIPLFNDIENPFLIYDRDLFREEVRELKVLKPEYIDQLLMVARQEKIINDRLSKEGKDE